MIKRHTIAISLFLIVLAASGAPTQAQTAHVANVTEIVDGDTLFIDTPLMNSYEIRLVGLQSPKLPLGRADFVAWPLADQAKAHLSELVLHRTVEISFGGRRMDRHGRLLAHLHVNQEDGERKWVQAEMLKAGYARVYSFSDNRSFVPELLSHERHARQNRQGIWALPYYAIRNPDPATLMKLLGSFQLVEGRIVDAARVKGRTYLNFGDDWRADFTVSISRENLKAFKAANLDLLSLSGQSVRVRGWLDSRNGPMINLSHPEQIEVLSR